MYHSFNDEYLSLDYFTRLERIARLQGSPSDVVVGLGVVVVVVVVHSVKHGLNWVIVTFSVP